MLTPHIFRAYDIRGIYQDDFDADGARAIAKAYATYLKKKFEHKDSFTVTLGRDGRTSGEILENAFCEGLRACGINVVKVGMVTSPLLYFSICAGGYDGGVMITASHNPAEYNGFKLQSSGAHAICGDEIQKIRQIAEKEVFLLSEEEGFLEEKDFEKEYFSLLEELSDTDLIKKHTDKTIVIDAGNGVCGKYAPIFFRQLGFQVEELYCEVDGNFPNHDADPEREENLRDLKKIVREKNAHLGIAFDGDGDRVGIVDNEGNHFSADLLLLLLARKILTENEGASIVYDLKSTLLLKDEIENLGGRAIMCKTGHSFVEEKMQEEDALLGGEVSGHIFIADKYFGYDDALLAALRLVEISIENTDTFTQILGKLPKTFVTPEQKIKVEESKKFAAIEQIVAELLEKYPDGLTIDGIRIEFGNGAWGIVRASNTSPYLTTRFEARSEEELEKAQSIMMEVITKYTS